MAMIDMFQTALVANPVLAGGIGTLLFGALLYILRSLPLMVWSIVTSAFWTRLSVESLSNEYRDIDGFIETQRFDFFSRSLEIKDGAVKTGFGSGWGLYGRILFSYAKQRNTQQITPLDTITVSFLTRDRKVAERFIMDARPEEHRNSIHVSIYGATGHNGGLRRRKRMLDTVFVDEAVKARLVERLTWFTGAEEWHARRGIPWKFGVVLHGPPGTGKTSLIHALASHFGFDIKYIKSLAALGQAFMTGTHNDLFVIEDIDTLSGSLNRTQGGGYEDKPASPLHEILNAMDGMQTPDGLKFIITTNHLSRLDPAIIRPGRIDEVVEIGPLSLTSARAMFRAFYGRDGISSYQPRTGAQLQQMFSTLSAEEAELRLASS